MHMFMACLGTETNTFSSLPCGLNGFNDTMLCYGDGSLNGRHPIVEPLRVWRRRAEALGLRISESVSAFAEPAGKTTPSAYTHLRDRILDDLKAALPVDLVLLSLHGAMIVDGIEDPEGELVREVRRVAGDDCLIGVEYDLHVNLTEQKTACADIVVAYKEYPHTDIGARAEELFDIAWRSVSGEVKPVVSIHGCPINAYMPTTGGKMREFVDGMISAESRPDILSVSLAHGFPHGDVSDNRAKVIVVSNGNSEAGGRLAAEMAERLWSIRGDLRPDYLGIDEALDAALEHEGGPVVLADTSDNAGCGAPNDSTFVLDRLVERKIENVISANYWDPIAVRFCMDAGIGSELTLRIGGKAGEESGLPRDLTVTVMGIQKDAVQTFNGNQVGVGDAVWVRWRSLDLILNSKRFQTGHPDLFTQFGLDPLKAKIIVVKSTQHFYAGFRPIASRIIYMAPPGGSNPDTAALNYSSMTKRYWPRDSGTIDGFQN